MILKIGKTHSLFYSYYTFYNDSLRTDPVGKQIAIRMTREAIRKKIIHWCLCHVLLMIIFISHIRNLAIIQPSRGWKEKWYRLLWNIRRRGQPTKMDNTAGFCQTNCRISLPIGLLPFQRQDMESMVYYRYTRQQWSMEISRITRINPRGIRFCLSLSLHFNRDKKTKSIPYLSL